MLNRGFWPPEARETWHNLPVDASAVSDPQTPLGSDGAAGRDSLTAVKARFVFSATLFDYNGVLVDDEHVHLAAFREVLKPLGVDVSREAYFERYIGFDDLGSFRAILSDAGRAPADSELRKLIQAKRPVYLAMAEGELRGFPGAAECVRRRAASGPVGVVSGALREEIELGLELLGVRHCVKVIIAAEDASEPKPHPEGYVRGTNAILKLAAPGHDCVLVVEDTLAGIEAAKAAGLTCAAVAHTYPAEALHRTAADLVVETLAELDERALRALHGRLHGA